MALPLAPRACLDALLAAELDNGSAPLFSEFSLDSEALTAAAVRAAVLRRAFASDIEPRLEREPPVVIALLLKQWLFSMLTSPLLSHSHAPRFVELAADLDRPDAADRVAATLAELFQLIPPRSVALVDALAAVLARLSDANALAHAANALAPILLWPNTSNDTAPPSLIEPSPGADALMFDVAIPVLQCIVAVRLPTTATARDVVYAATVQCGQIDAMAAYNGAFRLYLPPPRNLLCEITAPLAPFALTQYDGAVVVPADQGAVAQEREERVAISTSLWRFLATHHAQVFGAPTAAAPAARAAADDELASAPQEQPATLRRSTSRLAARNSLSGPDKVALLQKRFPNAPKASFVQVLDEVQGDVNEAISLLSLHRNYGGTLHRSNTLAMGLPTPPGTARPMPKVPGNTGAPAAAVTPAAAAAPAVKVPAAMRPAAPLPPGVSQPPAAAQSPKPQPRVFSIKPVFSGPADSHYQNASLVVPPGAGDVRLDEGGPSPIYMAPSVIVTPMGMQQQQQQQPMHVAQQHMQQQPAHGGLQPVYGPASVAAAAALEMERGKTIKGAPSVAAGQQAAAPAAAKGGNKFSKLMGKMRAVVGASSTPAEPAAANNNINNTNSAASVETMPSSPPPAHNTEVVHASVAGTVNGQLMLVTPQGMVIKCQVPGCAMAYRTQEELHFHERKRHADLFAAMETGEISPRFGSLKRSDVSDDSGTVVSDEASQRSDADEQQHLQQQQQHAPQPAPAPATTAPASAKPKPVHLCKAYYESTETYMTVPVYESTTPQDIIDFFRRRMKFDGVVVLFIRLSLGERWRPDASTQLLTSLGLRKLTTATVELCNATGELLRGVVRNEPTPAPATIPAPAVASPPVSARVLRYGALPGEDASLDAPVAASPPSALALSGRNYGTLPPEDFAAALSAGGGSDDALESPAAPVAAAAAPPNRPQYQRSVSAQVSLRVAGTGTNASDKQYQSAALQKTAPLVVKIAFLAGSGETTMNYVVSKLSTSRAVLEAFALKQRQSAIVDDLLLRIAFAHQDAAHASSGQVLLCDDIPLLLTYSRMALERSQFAVVIASTMQLCAVAAPPPASESAVPAGAAPPAARHKPLPPTPPGAPPTLAPPATRPVRKRSHSASSLPTVHYAGFGVPPDDPRPPRPSRPRPGTVAFKDAAAVRAALASGTEPNLPSQQRARDPTQTLRIAFTTRERAPAPPIAAEDPYASLPSLEELRKLQNAQLCDQCGVASAGAQVFNPSSERTLFLCRPCAISVADALGGDALDNLERPEKPPRPGGGARKQR